MIERYTIKFGPAVSQKELEKALHESGGSPIQSHFHKMKARIEIIADFEDLKKIAQILKEMKEIQSRRELDGSAHDGREVYDAERTRKILATKTY